MRANNRRSRRSRRRTLYVVALLPSLLLLLLSVRIWVVLRADNMAHDSYAAGDYAEAKRGFAGNAVLNPIEQWIAPFNEGDALFRLADHSAAAEAFEVALAYVPQERECDVRVNLALAREAEGDGLVEAGNRSEAEAAWRLGLTALAGCRTPAAVEVGRRLDAKLGDTPPETEPADPPPAPEDLEAREEQLADRNDRALRERLEEEQQDSGPKGPVPRL